MCTKIFIAIPMNLSKSERQQVFGHFLVVTKCKQNTIKSALLGLV